MSEDTIVPMQKLMAWRRSECVDCPTAGTCPQKLTQIKKCLQDNEQYLAPHVKEHVLKWALRITVSNIARGHRAPVSPSLKQVLLPAKGSYIYSGELFHGATLYCSNMELFRSCLKLKSG